MADFGDAAYRCRVHPATGAPVGCTFGEEHRAAVLAALTHYVRIEGRVTERDDGTEGLQIEAIAPVAVGPEPDGLDRGASMPFDAELTLEELAAQQGVGPIKSIEDLRSEMWPEDESVDDLVPTVRRWRDEDGQREKR